jgi:hypothetical protein
MSDYLWSPELTKTAYDKYFLLHGEADSRAAQARLKMTPEERLQSHPYIGKNTTGELPREFLTVYRPQKNAGSGSSSAMSVESTPATQSISSAETSIKQVPALFKNNRFEVLPDHRNLDIGGGKYDLGTEHLRGRGIESHVYDPYNRTPEHNQTVLDRFKNAPADSVTAANVLNVIPEFEARLGVIQQAYDNLQPGGKAYFSIYEGDKSGKGAATSKGYQRNAPANSYIDEISNVFPDIKRHGNILIGTKAPPLARKDGGCVGKTYLPLPKKADGGTVVDKALMLVSSKAKRQRGRP